MFSALFWILFTVSTATAWTTILQRGQFGNAKNYFQKNWEEYEVGFGEVNREFWLGLRTISALTSEGYWELLVELTAYNGSTYSARYTGFTADATDKYRLEYDSFYREQSTLGGYDALSGSKGFQFSTVDQDNDGYEGGSCSSAWGGGGWWFGRCGHCRLTGLNHNDAVSTGNGIVWGHLPAILPAGEYGSWPAVVMKIRRRDGTNKTTTSHGKIEAAIQTTATSTISVLPSTTDDKSSSSLISLHHFCLLILVVA